ncbi:DUF6281 family protein [Streptomyces sp. CRN 30]|uniref:DUF6281 family protein n=1 Tax=Streptomyces sp. CRN 30 TaxID=3075613 RepID=UPI002A827973|nr:DUF6281 family protein [Streptomyces sp. CRN 30]
MKPVRAVLPTAVMVVMSVGCTSMTSPGGESICAYVIEYEDRMYSDVPNADFTVGDRIGTATHPPCDDTPGDGSAGTEPTTTTAYAIEGVDAGTAITVDDAPAGTLLVAITADTGPGGELPPEVERLLVRP